MLARGLVEIADFALDKGAIREGAPFLVRFLTQIASRFGVVVSQKIAAQTVAVVGAGVGGTATADVPAEQHFPVVVVGAHGLLAVTTVVLVLLAALGVG